MCFYMRGKRFISSLSINGYLSKIIDPHSPLHVFQSCFSNKICRLSPLEEKIHHVFWVFSEFFSPSPNWIEKSGEFIEEIFLHDRIAKPPFFVMSFELFDFGFVLAKGIEIGEDRIPLDFARILHF